MNLINETFINITGKVKGNSLKARSTRGVTLLSVGIVIERILRMARNMILARILAPDAFGVMAIILTASTIFEALTDIGVRQSVIQNKEGAEPDYINVAWWFQGLRGIVLYSIGILAAPWVAYFYKMPDLLPLLRLALLGLVFNSLMSPRAYVLEKRLQFGKLVLLTQGSGVLSTLFTIGLAFYLKSILALVIGLVAESAIRCVMSFVLCPFRPRLSIHRGSLSNLLQFGQGMFGLALLTAVGRQTDIMVLGKVVSENMLGMYFLAFQLASQPALMFDRIVGGVLLPAFAEKQDNKESIRRAVLAIGSTALLFGIPLLAFVTFFARPILSLVYGSQYGSVSVPFILLCLWGLICTHGTILSSVFIGVGLPHLHRRVVALRVVILMSLIYPAIIFWGLSGAAMAVLATYLLTLIVSLIWMRKIINLSMNEYIMSWLPGLWISLIVVVPLILLRYLGATGPMFKMVVGIISCLVAWSTGLLLLYRSRFKQACFSR